MTEQLPAQSAVGIDTKPQTKPEVQSPLVSVDDRLRERREWVAAAMAIVIVLGTVIMFGLAFSLIASQDTFQRALDLLEKAMPLVTFVLGYYFTKSTTEARAESAETAAKVAADSAQQATQERDKAVTQAEVASSEAEELMASLKEVAKSAETMMEKGESAAQPGTLSLDRGGERAGETVETLEARLALQAALARAKRLMK